MRGFLAMLISWALATSAQAGAKFRADSAILNVEGELFEGQNALFLVRMVKDGSTWVFDRATNAGLIDK